MFRGARAPLPVAAPSRAQAFFTAAGITITRVLTDNGACNRSRVWADALTAAGIAHKQTRPYRPQTNCEGVITPVPGRPDS